MYYWCDLDRSLTNRIIFGVSEELGHGGPLTISTFKGLNFVKQFIKGTNELGIPENVSYNSGHNQGKKFHIHSINLIKMK